MDTEIKKVLYVIQGLPGSGKSTIGQKLAPGHCWSADDYFEIDGSYKFDKNKLPEAHDVCKINVAVDMTNNIPEIAVANTFTRNWEMEPYYLMAKQHGYEVQEIILKSRWNNIHNCPEEVIRRMAERFEYD